MREGQKREGRSEERRTEGGLDVSLAIGTRRFDFNDTSQLGVGDSVINK